MADVHLGIFVVSYLPAVTSSGLTFQIIHAPIAQSMHMTASALSVDQAHRHILGRHQPRKSRVAVQGELITAHSA